MDGNIYLFTENPKREDMLMVIYAQKNLRKYKIHYNF